MDTRLGQFILLSAIFCCTLLLAQNENTPTSGEKESNPRSIEEKRPKPAKGKEKPGVVLAGIYPIGIYDLDVSKNSYNIDFYAWWRSEVANYRPEKSIEIVNASSYRSTFGEWGKNGNEYFTNIHYYATIQHDWNLTYFPFDRQILEVRLEDLAEIQSIVFKPDYEHSVIHPELTIKGWDILGLKLRETTTHYVTNFGDVTTSQGLYSRLTFSIEIKREGWGLFFELFIGFFIAAFLCLMTCYAGFNSIETRFFLLLGAIFAFVINTFVISNVLWNTSGYTYVQLIQAITLVVLILSIIVNIYLIKRYAAKEEPDTLKSFNQIFAVVTAIIYILIVSYSTYLAVAS